MPRHRKSHWDKPRHFALDFSDGLASVGVVLSNPGHHGEPYKVAVVTDKHGLIERKGDIKRLPFLEQPTPEKWIADRWPRPLIRACLREATGGCVHPDGGKERGFAKLTGGNFPYTHGVGFNRALALLIGALNRLFEFPEPHTGPVLAAWVIATYFHLLFDAFPLLALTGEARSGKSKVLEYVQQVAFNGLRLLSPTPAVIYRVQERLRPTLCVDERDALEMSEGGAALKAILNAGYRKGNFVPRINMDKGGAVEMFDPYGPKILAGIRPLNDVTASRALTLPTVPGTDPDRINASVLREHERDYIVRAWCYGLLLTRWRDVDKLIRNQKEIFPSWLMGRDREVWLPLLVMAHLADDETEGRPSRRSFVTELLAYAQQEMQDRPSPVSENTRAVLDKLAAIVAKEGKWRGRPSDLLPVGHYLTAEKIGFTLRSLGIPRTGEGAKGSYYEATAQEVAEAYLRFGLPIPEELSQVV